ncbi:hypothetical protein E2320_011864, partial [Naja naja]
MAELWNAPLHCEFCNLDERCLLARATLTLQEALDGVAAKQSGRSKEEIQAHRSTSPHSTRWGATVHHEETEDVDISDDEKEDNVHCMRSAPKNRDADTDQRFQ